MSKEISDRTNRFAESYLKSGRIECSAAFLKFNFGVTGNRDLLSTYNGQAMLLSLVNIVARFHPSLHLLIPEDIETLVWVPFGQDRNLNKCAENITILVGSRVSKQDCCLDVLISIGKTGLTAKHKVTINSDGWLSFLSLDTGRLDFVSHNNNAIGALASSCFGAGEAFRRLLELLGSSNRAVILKQRNLIFSTLDYSLNTATAPNPALPSNVDLGAITVVGAGAVANGLIFALGVIPGLTTQVSIIDDQAYDEGSNLNRCLLANLSDKSKPKVASIASIKFDGVRIIPYQSRYESLKTSLKTSEIVLSTIDENKPRTIIQSDLPRLLFHGATGNNVGTISRHDFLNDACLGCLFFDDEIVSNNIAKETGLPYDKASKLLATELPLSTDEIRIVAEKSGIAIGTIEQYVGKPLAELYRKEICGVVKVNIAETEVAGTASFVSALPGVLLAGELLKEQISQFKQFRLSNYLSLSLFNPAYRWLLKKPKDERCSCLCGDQIMQHAYKEKWRSFAGGEQNG